MSDLFCSPNLRPNLCYAVIVFGRYEMETAELLIILIVLLVLNGYSS